MEQPETTDQERRERVTRNLESIQDCLSASKKLASDIAGLEQRYGSLGARLNALRDQVKRDLTVLDSALTSQ